MRTLRKGMAQMKDLKDQMNFYTCWTMFHNGASYKQIFVYTDNKNAWDGSEDTVIRKIKKDGFLNITGLDLQTNKALLNR